MNAFAACSEVERESLSRLAPYLEHISEGRYVLTHKGKLSRLLQEKAGDVLCNHPTKGHMFSLELKAEQFNKHDNFFFESWSNKSRFNPGWFWKTEADWLLYHFLDSWVRLPDKERNDPGERVRLDEIYVVPIVPLKRWAFETLNVAGVQRWRICKWPEREQKEHQQLNDTWGFCVPIEAVLADVPAAKRIPLPEAVAA